MPVAEESIVMPATVSASPSPTNSDSSAELTATFVAGFRSAKTRSNYTANLRDWFAWTEATAIGPWQAQRRDVESIDQPSTGQHLLHRGSLSRRLPRGEHPAGKP